MKLATTLRVWFAFSLLAFGADTVRQPLVNEDIVELVRAGFGESVVLYAVEANAGNFDVSPAAVALLRRSGVGETVIAAMVRMRGGPAPQLRLLEPGVYYRRTDTYALLRPDVIQWRGAASTVQTLSRIRLVGEVSRETSWLSLNSRTELLIVCEPGHACSDYQLLRGEQRTATRVFHAEAAVRQGTLLALGNVDDAGATVEFDMKFDLGVRVPLSTLRPGEYGLVPPDVIVNGRINDSGRIYTFTIE